MSSKISKAERKEDRIQQLERELAKTKKKLANSSKTIHLDEEQMEYYLDALTDRIEWSTNRIADEVRPKVIITDGCNKSQGDGLSMIIKISLGTFFIGIGLLFFGALYTKWATCWAGGVNKIATIFVICAAIDCIVIGVDIWREKDRQYLISLFSALVSLVALIVTLVRG